MMNVNNDLIFDLVPQHDTRKSFYGKAKVIITKDNRLFLQSYNTIVGEMTRDGEYIQLWDGKSRTTTRHINEFKKQYIFYKGEINND